MTTETRAEADIRAYARRRGARRKRLTEPRTDWRTTLDARISICPGCDDWRFDGKCSRCDAARVAS